MAIRTISRVSGEVLKTFDELTPEQLEEKLARAATAAESYRLTTIEQRVEWRGRAADHLEKDADSVGELITTEMGKTYRLDAHGRPPSESAQASNLTFMSNWTSGGHFT